MWVTVYNSFDEIPATVKERIRYPEQANYFLTLDWFSILYATVLQRNNCIRIYVASDSSDNPVGLLFCCFVKKSLKLTSLTNYYSLEYSPVIFPDTTPEHDNAIGALFDYILNEKPKWKTLDFRFLKSGKDDIHYLQSCFENTGYLVDTFFQYDNWYYERNNDDFVTYYNARPSRLRNTIKRKHNALSKAYSVDIIFYRENNESLAKGITDYTYIYNQSWKSPEPHSEFIPALITSCADLGVLRLGILYLDNVPVAAQLWITTQHKAVIYKLAYDKKYKNLSVGSILSRSLFELAIDEDQVDTIDYGLGNENYKKDWMSQAGKVTGFTAIDSRTMAGMFYKFKKLIKPLLIHE